MGNILDKTDKSLAANFGKAPVKAKRDVFDWTTGGVEGEFRMVQKTTLNIDSAYQRDQRGVEKVLKIARHWDWLLFGTISVIERNDLSLWVFDGGHRTRASFYRDDVIKLPCMVHSVDNVSDEAKAFVARNTMISNVSAVELQHAASCAGEPNAILVSELLNKHGLLMKKTCSSGNHIKCVGTLLRMVSIDASLADSVLTFMVEASNGDPVAASPLRGLFELCRRMNERLGIDVLREFKDKLSRLTQKMIEIEIMQKKAECGRGGTIVEAKAVLDIINKGKRNKIQWPD